MIYQGKRRPSSDCCSRLLPPVYGCPASSVRHRPARRRRRSDRTLPQAPRSWGFRSEGGLQPLTLTASDPTGCPLRWPDRTRFGWSGRCSRGLGRWAVDRRRGQSLQLLRLRWLLRGLPLFDCIDGREDGARELIVSMAQQVGQGEDLASGVSLDHSQQYRCPVEEHRRGRPDGQQ